MITLQRPSQSWGASGRRRKDDTNEKEKTWSGGARFRGPWSLSVIFERHGWVASRPDFSTPAQMTRERPVALHFDHSFCHGPGLYGPDWVGHQVIDPRPGAAGRTPLHLQAFQDISQSLQLGHVQDRPSVTASRSPSFTGCRRTARLTEMMYLPAAESVARLQLSVIGRCDAYRLLAEIFRLISSSATASELGSASESPASPAQLCPWLVSPQRRSPRPLSGWRTGPWVGRGQSFPAQVQRRRPPVGDLTRPPLLLPEAVICSPWWPARGFLLSLSVPEPDPRRSLPLDWPDAAVSQVSL
jgi:hypothetical protein